MNSIKLLLLLLLSIVTASFIHAQDLRNLVPRESSFTGVADMNKLKSKAGFAELAKLPFIEKMAQSVAEKMFKDSVKENFAGYLDLGKYGINTSGKAYFYFKTDPKVYYGAMLIPLNNEAEFTAYVKKLTTDTAGSHVTVKNNVKVASIRELKLVWNDKAVALWNAFISPVYKDSLRKSMEGFLYNPTGVSVDTIAPPPPPLQQDDSVAIVEAPVPPFVIPDTSSNSLQKDTTVNMDSNYNPSRDPYMVMYNKVDSICKGITSEWCRDHEANLLMDKGAASLSADPEFKTFVKSQPDIAFIVDYGQIASIYMSSLGSMASMFTGGKSPLSGFTDLYKGMVFYAKIEHNRNDIVLNASVKYSGMMKEIYKDVKKKNIGADFLKYMSNDLMGYYAMGIDIKAISKGVGNYMKKVLPEIPQYGPIATSALDVLDIFIDEERLYNIFSGDVVLAVNGIKPTRVIHSTYKFDDNYNRTEVNDTTTQMRPEILLMLGIGNRGDVEKILKLFNTSQLLKQYGNYYGLAKNNSSLPVYFRIQDNILFITNSQSFAENPVVYAGDKQLDKTHAALFKKNTSVLYVDIASITGFFAKDTTTRYQKNLTSATALFSSVTMYGSHKPGYAESKCVLKLKETTDNALVDIIKFINTIYENSTKVKYE